MDAAAVLFPVLTVLAWGTWLAPSQSVRLPNAQTQTLYVSLGNIVLASIALFVVGPERLTGRIFLYPFLGGVIWSISGWCAFTATARIGIARAFGTWAPLNIVTAFCWGMLLFGEFRGVDIASRLTAIGSVAVIIVGILCIVIAGGVEKNPAERRASIVGFGAAIGAGVLWGTYFIPTSWLARNMTGVDDWVAAFPMAVGMLVGSLMLALLGGRSPRLESARDYGRVLSSGLLWSIGNFSMLLMVSRIGVGKGFTIAQLCVVVNALVGIYVFQEPAPRSRAAKLTLTGILLATVGGVVLGNLKA